MNFSIIIKAIEFASEHKAEIAEGAKAAIAGIRAIEDVCHKHGKSLDHVLHIAHQVCDAVDNPPNPVPPPAAEKKDLTF